jgi:hypothetical protein
VMIRIATPKTKATSFRVHFDFDPAESDNWRILRPETLI